MSIAAAERSEVIAHLGALTRAGDPSLSALTRLAAYICGVPGAAVHLHDETRQHRVAGTSLPLDAQPREDTLCRLVVDEEQRIVCADASRDPRFGYSSFITGPSPIRFYASVPLRTSDDVVIGALCAFDFAEHDLSDEQVARLEDLADQVVSQMELTRVAVDLGHLAAHDPLTGAVNRLVLGDRLAQAFARRRRHGGETFVALLDVDQFKLINDIHGHDAGDQVLVTIAKRLSGAMREEDTVARIGGDEFVVLAELVPMIDLREELCERIEGTLAPPIHFAGAPRPVRVSVGSVLAQPGEDVRSLLARADAAMYERKRSRGRPLG